MPKRNLRKRSTRRGNHGRRSTRRNAVRRGGGQGSGWTPGGPVVPGIQNDAQIHVPYDSCLSAPRPGQIAFSLTGGLPGMRGVMSGGAYTNNLVGDIAGFPQIDRLPCTPNYVNPLNQVGSHQAFVYPQVEGITVTQKGGVGLQTAEDMGVYEAPTARYTHAPSQWTDSVGAPVLLNQALDSRQWSKACTATAGGRRRGRKNRRNRKTRKNRSNRH
jgi:hypothetical protein